MRFDNGGKPRNILPLLGQESMARVGTGCMWQEMDFPATAFSRAGPAPHEASRCASITTTLHMRDR